MVEGGQQMKIFGSTKYVRTEPDSSLIGWYCDVEPLEPYLQLYVKSQWDWNPDNFYLVFDGEFSYYVRLSAKEDNSTYNFSKLLKEEDITDEHKELIKNYLNR